MGSPALIAAIVSVPAHGVGSRQDLPLPFTAVLIGAATALLVSFVALGFLWPEPALHADSGHPLSARPPRTLSSSVLNVVLVALGLLLADWPALARILRVGAADNPIPLVGDVGVWAGSAVLAWTMGRS